MSVTDIHWTRNGLGIVKGSTKPPQSTVVRNPDNDRAYVNEMRNSYGMKILSMIMKKYDPYWNVEEPPYEIIISGKSKKPTVLDFAKHALGEEMIYVCTAGRR